MSKLLVVAMSVALFVTVGCKNKDEDMSDSTMSGSSSASGSTMSAGADACSHCTGTQTAKADGTCPVCGGKAK